MALTERQQEIKGLIENEGLKPDQIAKKLGITTNAVYQQLRRMRGGKAAKKSGRKSGGQRPAAASPIKPTPAPQVAAPPPTPTPLQSVRARRDEIKATLKVAQSSVTDLERELEAAKATVAKIESRHKEEMKALDRAEAALRPAPRTPKEAPAKPAAKSASAAKDQGTPANGAGAPPGGASAPQEPQEGQPQAA